MNWTDDEVQALKTLHGAGLSASRIAVRLGRNISRSAVLGKLNRLGLCTRKPFDPERPPKPRKPRLQREPVRPTLPAKACFSFPKSLKPPPPPLPRLTAGGRVTVLGLTERTCRWPIGNPGNEDFCFCGHSPRDGSPYCEYHASIAYRPRPDRHAGSV